MGHIISYINYKVAECTIYGRNEVIGNVRYIVLVFHVTSFVCLCNVVSLVKEMRFNKRIKIAVDCITDKNTQGNNTLDRMGIGMALTHTV